jgi:hypothetical protein
MIGALLNAPNTAIKRNKGRAGADPLSSAAGPPQQSVTMLSGAKLASAT